MRRQADESNKDGRGPNSQQLKLHFAKALMTQGSTCSNTMRITVKTARPTNHARDRHRGGYLSQHKHAAVQIDVLH